MNTPNVLSGSTPLNPVLAMPNLPAPQVISGVLGQQGNPPLINPPLDLQSIMNVDLSTLTDVLGSFTIDTSMNVGTEVFSTRLPVIRGPVSTFGDEGSVTTTVLNWANLALCSHMYYNPIQHLGFVVIAPEPVKGKILAVWNPSETSSSHDVAPQYSARRRMITEEWDLAESKTYFRTFLPNGLVNQMSTEEQQLPRVPSGIQTTSNLIAPSYSIPSQFRNFGTFSLFIEQEIQVGSIFPKQYTVIAFSCFAGTQLSVPVDPRRNAYTNDRDSVMVAHRNFFSSRFNQMNPTPSVTVDRPKSQKSKIDTIGKPPVLPRLRKYNV